MTDLKYSAQHRTGLSTNEYSSNRAGHTNGKEQGCCIQCLHSWFIYLLTVLILCVQQNGEDLGNVACSANQYVPRMCYINILRHYHNEDQV